MGLLVLKDLRVRYKSSLLGYLWALANPLAMAVVYYVAFQMIMRVSMPNYGVYLITGLFPWAWISTALIASAGVYRANESLVRKVRLPRGILPLSTTLQEMAHFFFACPVLLAAMVVTTGRVHASWIVLIPFLALVQLALIYPLGLILASLNVLARDVEYLVAIVLQMAFFLTPIVYAPAAIPQQMAPLFRLNPFFPMIAAWRALFYDGVLDMSSMAQVLVFAAVFALLATVIHRSVEPRIGELL
jgi:lipopolysaccharide transport system permease protein